MSDLVTPAILRLDSLNAPDIIEVEANEIFNEKCSENDNSYILVDLIRLKVPENMFEMIKFVLL